MPRNRTDMAAETRAKLIEAGREAFGNKGYADASMDDIAAAVGLTRGAIYHHFGDKKGLFQAVVEQIDDEIDQKIVQVTHGNKTSWTKFLMESRCYLEFMLIPEIQQIVIRDGRSVLGDINDWPSQAKYHELMADTLTLLMDTKNIKRCDAYALARQINGALFNAAFWIAESAKPRATLTRAWEAFALLMDGLRIH